MNINGFGTTKLVSSFFSAWLVEKNHVIVIWTSPIKKTVSTIIEFLNSISIRIVSKISNVYMLLS